jgi:hypothetical protein
MDPKFAYRKKRSESKRCQNLQAYRKKRSESKRCQNLQAYRRGVRTYKPIGKRGQNRRGVRIEEVSEPTILSKRCQNYWYSKGVL